MLHISDYGLILRLPVAMEKCFNVKQILSIRKALTSHGSIQAILTFALSNAYHI